jgi:sodium/hydrogen exchanger 8
MQVLVEFFMASIGSAFFGVLFGFVGALLTKHLSLRNSPSLEFSLLCILAYL